MSDFQAVHDRSAAAHDRMPDGTPINDRTIGPLMARYVDQLAATCGTEGAAAMPNDEWTDRIIQRETFAQTLRDSLETAAERNQFFRDLITQAKADDGEGGEPPSAA